MLMFIEGNVACRSPESCTSPQYTQHYHAAKNPCGGSATMLRVLLGAKPPMYINIGPRMATPPGTRQARPLWGCLWTAKRRRRRRRAAVPA